MANTVFPTMRAIRNALEIVAKYAVVVIIRIIAFMVCDIIKHKTNLQVLKFKTETIK